MATRNFETEPKQQRQSQRGYSGNLYCLRDGVLNPAEGEWENSTATATTATADDAIQSEQFKASRYATSENRRPLKTRRYAASENRRPQKMPNFIQNGMGIAEESPIAIRKPAPYKGFKSTAAWRNRSAVQNAVQSAVQNPIAQRKGS